jgi:hypothetical protein
MLECGFFLLLCSITPMKKKQLWAKKIIHTFCTFKFPLKLLAFILIVFLGLITLFFTYKASIEVWDFIKLAYASEGIKKDVAILIAFIISVATLIQSSPIIWQRLEYWGQNLDNFLIYLITKRRYFLDEVDSKLKNSQDKINYCNFKLQEYNWDLNFSSTIDQMKVVTELDELLSKEINNIKADCMKAHVLLGKCNPTDTINIQRKINSENNLNILIVHNTEIAIRIAKLKSYIIENASNH